MSEKEKNKKRLDKNLKESNDQRDAYADKAWLKGTKTAMEKDILAAGREKKKQKK